MSSGSADRERRHSVRDDNDGLTAEERRSNNSVRGLSLDPYEDVGLGWGFNPEDDAYVLRFSRTVRSHHLPC